MRRFAALVPLTALLAAAGAFVSPARAVISTPANGSVLRGVITVTEANGGECNMGSSLGPNTWIRIYNSGGGVVVDRAKGSCGAFSISWTTETVPNGSYQIRSSGRFCTNRVFGTCFSSETRDISNYTVTVQNLSTITYSGPTGGTWDDVANVSANLRDSTTGWVIPGRSVRFQIGTQVVSASTDAGGNAYASIKVGGTGTTTVSAAFDGDAFYVGSSAAFPFTVDPVPTTTRLDGPFAGTWGSEVTLRATLAKASPRSGALAGRSVTITLGPRSTTATTDANGQASAVFLLDMAPGSLTYAASFVGDGGMAGASSATGTFNSIKRQTTLSYSGDAQVPWNEEAALAAKLVDSQTGVGIWGEVVRFDTAGVNAQAVTDVDGNASVNVAIVADPGSYGLTATYDGDAGYEASQSVGQLQVVPRLATLDLSSPDSVVWKKTASLTARLTDSGTGDPLSGKQVSISFSSHSQTVTTDASGTAVATFATEDDLPGSYAAGATYPGETRHVGSWATRPLEILRRGTRVVLDGQIRSDDLGDLSGTPWATLGARVVDLEDGATLEDRAVTLAAGTQSSASTSDAGGRAEAAFAISQSRGLYDLVAEAPADPRYSLAATRSLFAVGWDAYTTPGNAGAVFVDVPNKVARAIVGLDNPTQDTGVVPVPGLTTSQTPAGERVVTIDGGPISGTFNRDDATFEAVVRVGTSNFPLARTTNSRPQADAGPDPDATEGDSLAMAGQGSDTDGDRLYYWWDFGDGSSAGGAQVTHVYDDELPTDHVYTATLTVADGAGARTRRAISVDVTDTDSPNRPPVLSTIGDRAVQEMQILTFDVSATDENAGDTLILSASPLPSGATFSDRGDGTGTFSWRPTSTQAGSWDVTFTASDSSGDADTDTVMEQVAITVAEAARGAMGSSGLEYQTAQEALDDPAAGSFVRVLPGTHPQALTIARPGVTLCGATDATGGACITDRAVAGAVVLGAPEGPTIRVEAADAKIQGLTFDRYDRAVVVTARATLYALRFGSGNVGVEVASATSGTLMRQSLCTLNTPVCVGFAPGIGGQTVDARLNDWSMYLDPLISGRVKAAGNTVMQKPYLMP